MNDNEISAVGEAIRQADLNAPCLEATSADDDNEIKVAMVQAFMEGYQYAKDHP